MTQSTRAQAAAAAALDRIDPATVTGWGVDADPANDPTRPMRNRSGEDGAGAHWVRPPLQDPEVEILKSVEHTRLPAVLGLSTPPRGLSGSIRRTAFRFSESQWGHWLLLILADRIGSVEGLISDFAQGRPPNVLVETGRVKRSRSRDAAAATLAVGALAAVGVVWLARRAMRA